MHQQLNPCTVYTLHQFKKKCVQATNTNTKKKSEQQFHVFFVDPTFKKCFLKIKNSSASNAPPPARTHLGYAPHLHCFNLRLGHLRGSCFRHLLGGFRCCRRFCFRCCRGFRCSSSFGGFGSLGLKGMEGGPWRAEMVLKISVGSTRHPGCNRHHQDDNYNLEFCKISLCPEISKYLGLAFKTFSGSDMARFRKLQYQPQPEKLTLSPAAPIIQL